MSLKSLVPASHIHSAGMCSLNALVGAVKLVRYGGGEYLFPPVLANACREAWQALARLARL